MTTRSILLSATAALALCGTAQAGHHNGWYIGIEGGANWIDDTDAVVTADPAGPTLPTIATATFEADTGWAVLGTVGYAFANNWRLEAELGYRDNETSAGTDSDSEWSLMVNALYDINLTPKLDLSLGAGVGYDVAKLDLGGVVDDTEALAGLDDIGGGFALRQPDVNSRRDRRRDDESDQRPHPSLAPLRASSSSRATRHPACRPGLWPPAGGR